MKIDMLGKNYQNILGDAGGNMPNLRTSNQPYMTHTTCYFCMDVYGSAGCSDGDDEERSPCILHYILFDPIHGS